MPVGGPGGVGDAACAGGDDLQRAILAIRTLRHALEGVEAGLDLRDPRLVAAALDRVPPWILPAVVYRALYRLREAA